MRLIDAEALKEYILRSVPNWSEDREIVLDCIANSPTIEERKTGKWEIYVISPFDGEGCRCSECGFEGAPYWDFCPNCGSYNGGGNDETD